MVLGVDQQVLILIETYLFVNQLVVARCDALKVRVSYFLDLKKLLMLNFGWFGRYLQPSHLMLMLQFGEINFACVEFRHLQACDVLVEHRQVLDRGCLFRFLQFCRLILNRICLYLKVPFQNRWLVALEILNALDSIRVNRNLPLHLWDFNGFLFVFKKRLGIVNILLLNDSLLRSAVQSSDRLNLLVVPEVNTGDVVELGAGLVVLKHNVGVVPVETANGDAILVLVALIPFDFITILFHLNLSLF